MAKLKGPALSLEASGALGDSVVFSSWRGRRYAKKLTIPSNPSSPLQVSKRAMLRFLSQQHSTLSDADRATWSTLAGEFNISTYNAFVAYNLDRWEEFLLPTKAYPASDAGDSGWFPSLTATARVRSINLATIRPTGNDQWGYIFHRSQTPGFTKTQANAIRVILYTSPMPTSMTWNDSPLQPGTYYYRLSAFSTTGHQNPTNTLIASATVS